MPHLQFENQAQRSVWEDLHQLNITVRRSQYAPFLEIFRDYLHYRDITFSLVGSDLA